MKAPSSTNKQYIVFMLKPDAPSTAQTPLAKTNADFGAGSFLAPKSKRGFDDDYGFGGKSRNKGTCTINITLPFHGAAAGVSFEIRGVDNTEFLCICNSKIKIDQFRLLEDGSSAAFSKTVQQLLELKSDGEKYPPALDPVKGMVLYLTA